MLTDMGLTPCTSYADSTTLYTHRQMSVEEHMGVMLVI
jgi:hypothetical protein